MLAKEVVISKMFKGDVGRFNAMVKRITQIGLEDDVNIAFRYEGDIGTTIDCSQLIMWAESYGLQYQHELKDQFMRAYHEQAKNIALKEVMLDCVKLVNGLKDHVDEAETVLNTNLIPKSGSRPDLGGAQETRGKWGAAFLHHSSKWRREAIV